MPFCQASCSAKVILAFVCFGGFPHSAMAEVQTIAISDSQSVTVGFPDTTYYYPTPGGCEGSVCRCNYAGWIVVEIDHCVRIARR